MGRHFSVSGPVFTKKSLAFAAMSTGLLNNFPLVFNWVILGENCLFNIYYRSYTFPHLLNITRILIEITIIMVFLGLSNFSIYSVSKQIIEFGNVCIVWLSFLQANNLFLVLIIFIIWSFIHGLFFNFTSFGLSFLMGACAGSPLLPYFPYFFPYFLKILPYFLQMATKFLFCTICDNYLF